MNALTACPAASPNVAEARRHRRAFVAHHRKRHDPQKRVVDDEVQDHDSEDTEAEAERKRFLRVRDFSRDMGDVGPSVVGEENRGDTEPDEAQKRGEAATARALGIDQWARCHGFGQQVASAHEDEQAGDLDGRQNDLSSPSPFDSHEIDPGEHDDGDDSPNLRGAGALAEKAHHELAKHDRDSGDGTGGAHPRLHPNFDEAPGGTERFAHDVVRGARAREE